MLFFDFLYYKIAKTYESYNEKGAESSSAAVVGACQAFNVLTVLTLILSSLKEPKHVNVVVGVIIVVIFQITTYVRYLYRDKYSIDVIETKWLQKTKAYQRQTSVIMVLYGATSFLGFLGLALYLGSKS
jgi:hypothetical protein